MVGRYPCPNVSINERCCGLKSSPFWCETGVPRMLDSPGPRVKFRSTVVKCRTSQQYNRVTIWPFYWETTSSHHLCSQRALHGRKDSAFDTRNLFAYMTPQGCCNTESVNKHDPEPSTKICMAIVTRRHRGCPMVAGPSPSSSISSRSVTEVRATEDQLS